MFDLSRKFALDVKFDVCYCTQTSFIFPAYGPVLERQMPTPALFLRTLFLLAFTVGCVAEVGCQSSPWKPGETLFPTTSPSSTISPPGTGSYTPGSAPKDSSTPGSANNYPPSSTGAGDVFPFAPNRPYGDNANETEKSQENGTAVQPFQSNLRVEAETAPQENWTAASQSKAEIINAGSVAAGASQPTARTGDEIEIPVSAFRTDTGLYANGSIASKSAGTVTQTSYIAPFQPDADEDESEKAE